MAKKIDNKKELKKLKEKSGGFVNEFKEFILRGNVMDMAVGVIIGSAFSNIVTALTKDFINPLINGIGGAEINGQIKIYGGQALNWGHFLTSVINFLITALVIFILIKGINALNDRLSRKTVEKPAAPTTKKCPYCMSEIAIEATKCPHCTSNLD